MNQYVDFLVVGHSFDCDIAIFVIIAVDVGKIACFLKFVAIGLGYVDILAWRERESANLSITPTDDAASYDRPW